MAAANCCVMTVRRAKPRTGVVEGVMEEPATVKASQLSLLGPQVPVYFAGVEHRPSADMSLRGTNLARMRVFYASQA
jgi:hypothetical protein